MTAKPVLWHIEVSHYSEKARWALDYKGLEADLRAPTPGAHIAVALWLTGGRHITFPILQLDGRTVPDSTGIIAALEASHPEPPLYPDDPGDRRRALELEEFFDEELGPHIRLLAFHELQGDPERFAELAAESAPKPLQRYPRAVGLYSRAFTAARFRVRNRDAAQVARTKVLAAIDRLEGELGDGDYMVGDSFSVADLTAAALFYPLVLPPGSPVKAERMPVSFAHFREALSDRRGFRWVEEMYERHRSRSPAAAPAA